MLGKIASLTILNLMGPVIVFVSTPIVSRVYLPSSIGEYYYILGLATLLSLMVSGALYNGIYAETRNAHANKMFRECVSIVVFFSVLIQILLAVVCVTLIAFGLPTPTFNYYLLVPLAMALALSQIGLMLLSRFRRYSASGKLSIFRSVFLVSSQLVIGTLFSPTTSVLIATAILTEILVFSISAFFSPHFILFLKVKHLFKVPVRYKSHVSFTKYFLPSQLVSTGANTLPLVFLRQLGNAELLGVFTMLMRLTMVPSNAVAQSIRSIYWNWVREHKANAFLAGLITSASLQVLAVLVSGLYLHISPSLLETYLGGNWGGIDSLFPYVAVWVFSSLANVPLIESVKFSLSPKIILNTEIFLAIGKVVVLLATQVAFEKFNIEVFCVGSWFLNVVVSVALLVKLRK